jgi:drug/metabolite transporter (DMT)-like permease
MLAAGIAWGIYSLRGRAAGSPLKVTTGNFVRAAPIAIGLALANLDHSSFDSMGILYAISSGALASGIGYSIWYTALPSLKATSAATIQLSVPVLAGIGGLLFLGEALTPRLVLASLAILGGIALVILARPRVRG